MASPFLVRTFRTSRRVGLIFPALYQLEAHQTVNDAGYRWRRYGKLRREFARRDTGVLADVEKNAKLGRRQAKIGPHTNPKRVENGEGSA